MTLRASAASFRWCTSETKTEPSGWVAGDRGARYGRCAMSPLVRRAAGRAGLDEDEQAGGFHHTVFALGGGQLLGLHTYPSGHR